MAQGTQDAPDLKYHEEMRAHQKEMARLNSLRKAGIEDCFEAGLTADNKYQCPLCKSIEGGTLRIITHPFSCPNRSKKICQQIKGGRRKHRVTRKNRRTCKTCKTHRRYSRRK
jgi:hypothetical protein